MGRSKKKLNVDRFPDFTVPLDWKAYVEVLTSEYRFEMITKSGSVRVFIRDAERFTADQPHGKGDLVVSKEDRKKAIRALIRLGLIE